MSTGQIISAAIFDILALIFFGVILYYLLSAKRHDGVTPPRSVNPAVILFMFCALMGNPTQFESLKISVLGSTIETKARDVIQQVQITLEQLRKISTASAQANLAELAMSGQMLSGLNTDYKFAIRDRIIDSLREIGVDDKDLLQAQDVWINVYGRLLLSHIEGISAKLLPTEKAVDEIESLPKSKYGLPSPKAVQDWVASKSLNNPTLTQFLDEYQNVWTTGAMKNPGLIQFNETIVNP